MKPALAQPMLALPQSRAPSKGTLFDKSANPDGCDWASLDAGRATKVFHTRYLPSAEEGGEIGATVAPKLAIIRLQSLLSQVVQECRESGSGLSGLEFNHPQASIPAGRSGTCRCTLNRSTGQPAAAGAGSRYFRNPVQAVVAGCVRKNRRWSAADSCGRLDAEHPKIVASTFFHGVVGRSRLQKCRFGWVVQHLDHCDRHGVYVTYRY